jgi:chemotaxis protein CheX
MSEPATLTLGEVLDLKAAAPLTESLRAHRGQPLEIDATAVRRLGGLCLQALLAAQTSWDAEGTPFAIIPSPEFTEGAALLGAATLTANA